MSATFLFLLLRLSSRRLVFRLLRVSLSRARKITWLMHYLLDLMNAVILTTVLSAGNSGLYASSRTLFDLANEGKAPKFFKRVTRNGIPIYCVLLTAVIGMLAFLTSLFGNGVVYNWLLNISGVAGFIAWYVPNYIL